MINRTILVIDPLNEVYRLLQDRLQYRLVHISDFTDRQAIWHSVQEHDAELILIGAEELTGEIISLIKYLHWQCPTSSVVVAARVLSSDMLIEAVNVGVARICKLPATQHEIVWAITETLQGWDIRSEITRLKALLPVYDLGRKFISAASESAIYEELVKTVARELRVARASVLLYDEQDNLLRLVAQQGLAERIVENLTIRPGERIAGRVFQEQAPVILNSGDDFISPYRELLQRSELAASICFPFVSKEKTVLGVLNISETEQGKEFCEADVDMLRIITDQALMAVENLRFIEQQNEQKRLRQALEQYISPELSDVLVSKSSSEQLLDVGGMHDLTILFADIRNFTMLAQELPLHELRHFLNKFFAIFSRAVFAEKGMLDKFMGDAVLAVFGAPFQQADSCSAAVSAACRIANEFVTLKEMWQKENPVFSEVALGLGVSKGLMFLGNVGSTERLDYTVLGLDVNIAQRLASEKSAGGVYVTEKVYEGLDNRFVVLEKSQKKLRGVRTPMTIYAVNMKKSH